MVETYKWIGMGWKSLKALILRAPLCGANNRVWPLKQKTGSFLNTCVVGAFLQPSIKKIIHVKSLKLFTWKVHSSHFVCQNIRCRHQQQKNVKTMRWEVTSVTLKSLNFFGKGICQHSDLTIKSDYTRSICTSSFIGTTLLFHSARAHSNGTMLERGN